MTTAAAKLAFAHRVLWQRDVTYRAAVLLGPAPIIGCMIGAALWFALHAISPADTRSASWAHPQFAVQRDAPTELVAGGKLPPVGSDGRFVGVAPGWIGSIHAVSISPTMDVNVHENAEGSRFVVGQPKVDVVQIIQEGAKTGLFVGDEFSVLAIRNAGRYGVSVRLERSGGNTADCLVRLGIGGGRVLSQYDINLAPDAVRDYDPAEFNLQPGLYKMGMAFGCWHNQQMTGPATLTVMLKHPGETRFQPATDQEIIRPVNFR